MENKFTLKENTGWNSNIKTPYVIVDESGLVIAEIADKESGEILLAELNK